MERVRGRVEWLEMCVRQKEKVYRRIVRPAIMYGLQTVALTKRHGAEVKLTEFKMLRF